MKCKVLCIALFFVFGESLFSQLQAQEVPTCENNPTWGADNIVIPQNFASEWCATEGKWGCGVATLVAGDKRNLANEDYTCNCNEANEKCPEYGWNLAEAGLSCTDACSAVGLACSEDLLYARNEAVDSSQEVLDLIRTRGGITTNITECTGTATSQPGVPLYNPSNDRCTISAASRASSSFDCGHAPTPASAGKRRLCWCY